MFVLNDRPFKNIKYNSPIFIWNPKNHLKELKIYFATKHTHNTQNL